MKPVLLLEDPSEGSHVKGDCVVTAIRNSNDQLTIHVTLSGSVTIPEFAARELLKGHDYRLADLMLDKLLPAWVPELYPLIDRKAKETITGVRSFDPEMTHTLR